MNKSSRRRFLAATGATTAAVGAAAILPGSVAEAQRPENLSALNTAESQADAPLADTVLVACVNDLERGEVTVINNDHEITVTDPGLAGLIARISRSEA